MILYGRDFGVSFASLHVWIAYLSLICFFSLLLRIAVRLYSFCFFFLFFFVCFLLMLLFILWNSLISHSLSLELRFLVWNSLFQDLFWNTSREINNSAAHSWMSYRTGAVESSMDEPPAWLPDEDDFIFGVWFVPFRIRMIWLLMLVWIDDRFHSLIDHSCCCFCCPSTLSAFSPDFSHCWNYWLAFIRHASLAFHFLHSRMRIPSQKKLDQGYGFFCSMLSSYLYRGLHDVEILCRRKF